MPAAVAIGTTYEAGGATAMPMTVPPDVDRQADEHTDGGM
jgi:hypothetical protein